MNNTQTLSPFSARQAKWQSLQKNRFFITVLPLLMCGVLMGGTLTWFMHYLIESTYQELDRSPRMRILEFVRVKRDESSEAKAVKPKRPQMQDKPQTPDMPDPASNADSSGQLGVNIASMQPSNAFDIAAGGYSLDMNDGDYLPIVKIAPVYPAKARRMGLEGQCVAQFTVTPQGTVRDVSIIESMCDHPVFHKPSIDAAYNFRYKPRVIDGEAIEVPNVKNRFIYQLEK